MRIRSNEKLQFLQSGACSGRVPLSRSRRRGASFSFVLSDAEMRRIQRRRMAGNGVGYCRDSRERASIAGAKRYLETGPNRGSIDREALRWFFVTYRQRHEAGHPTQPVPVIVEAPTPMPIPPGTPPWVADLIRKQGKVKGISY